MQKHVLYAMYFNQDIFVACGTPDELAKNWGITKNAIFKKASKTYAKKHKNMCISYYRIGDDPWDEMRCGDG
jgi:hypothetical protein